MRLAAKSRRQRKVGLYSLPGTQFLNYLESSSYPTSPSRPTHVHSNRPLGRGQDVSSVAKSLKPRVLAAVPERLRMGSQIKCNPVDGINAFMQFGRQFRFCIRCRKRAALRPRPDHNLIRRPRGRYHHRAVLRLGVVATVMDVDDGQSTGFLSLPVELRLKIYKTYLQETIIRIPGPQIDPNALALLSTCRTIHDEASPLVPSTITFSVWCTEHLIYFLSSLPENTLRSLRHVAIIQRSGASELTISLLL
ncbi:hypothetical protein BDN72DRAFT_837000 [Pluteus cervinus]|uniref:Uncharacterized protein n=1 Tax=Pluteus cervinus TaxID=181527 RepID=A0ACD3B1L5_9AGAR|nr:hypothetical protein BDN72DRAFT_837000 [Pluteus cervinus]